MTIEIRVVESADDLEKFILFPWKIYPGDPNWVPPLIEERTARLDEACNPFWRSASRALWMAWEGGQPIGTIAAFIDHRSNAMKVENNGQFGFFECVNQPDAAHLLIQTAADWLRQRAIDHMVGPYNPSMSDECGILVEGFETRPAILTAHTARYYPALLEGSGLKRSSEMVARLYTRPPGATFEQACPEKLRRVYERVRERKDVCVRSIQMKKWKDEIRMACQIYNAALAPLAGFLPLTQDEFQTFADSFRMLIDPDLALIVEVSGVPAGFALALPDINEALMHVNGRLNTAGKLKLWWHSRRMKRISFKILMILPDYQKRGIEALLIYQICKTIFEKGYQEIDLSLTGENNLPSNFYQQSAGVPVYRRYWIYQMELS